MAKTKPLVSTTSVAVSPETRDELKAIATGLGAGTSYNDVIRLLMALVLKRDENAYEAGRRLAAEHAAKPARNGDRA